MVTSWAASFRALMMTVAALISVVASDPLGISVPGGLGAGGWDPIPSQSTTVINNIGGQKGDLGLGKPFAADKAKKSEPRFVRTRSALHTAPGDGKVHRITLRNARREQQPFDAEGLSTWGQIADRLAARFDVPAASIVMTLGGVVEAPDAELHSRSGLYDEAILDVALVGAAARAHTGFLAAGPSTTAAAAAAAAAARAKAAARATAGDSSNRWHWQQATARASSSTGATGSAANE
jgi:hypothetical protein